MKSFRQDLEWRALRREIDGLDDAIADMRPGDRRRKSAMQQLKRLEAKLVIMRRSKQFQPIPHNHVSWIAEQRGSYERAVSWIAEHDHSEDTSKHRLSEETVYAYLTVVFVADLYDIEQGRVAHDVVKMRKEMDRARSKPIVTIKQAREARKTYGGFDSRATYEAVTGKDFETRTKFRKDGSRVS